MTLFSNMKQMYSIFSSQDAKFYLLHLASMFVLECRYSMKGILLESMEIRFDYRLLRGFTKSLVRRNGKKRERIEKTFAKILTTTSTNEVGLTLLDYE